MLMVARHFMAGQEARCTRRGQIGKGRLVQELKAGLPGATVTAFDHAELSKPYEPDASDRYRSSALIIASGMNRL